MRNLEEISKTVFYPPFCSSELFAKFCGYLKMDNTHEIAINKPSGYVLLYVLSGTGAILIDKREHYINPNNILLIAPNTVSAVKSDDILPLTFFWVCFNGSRAKALLAGCGFNGGSYFNAEFSGNDDIGDCLRNLVMLSDRTDSESCASIGYLYLLFSLLAKKGLIKKIANLDMSYVAKAVKYINENYQNGITVQDAAAFVNLERTYFAKIFKLDMGVSPQKYLIDMRMTKAVDILRMGNVSLKELCSQIGYTNYNNFCKMFRTRYGISPQKFVDK